MCPLYRPTALASELSFLEPGGYMEHLRMGLTSSFHLSGWRGLIFAIPGSELE